MKRVLIATLSTVMALGMAAGMTGCASSQEGGASLSNPDASVVITDEQVDKPLGGGQDALGDGLGDNAGDNAGQSDLIASENPGDNKDSAAAASGDAAIAGTWQTASLVTSTEGTVAPSHYIQFSATDIKYGQMKDGAFVEEYADKITKLDKTAAGGFIVQAESTNGVKYTYKTSDTDVNTMDYYETWDEAQYSEKYSASGSIIKST